MTIIYSVESGEYSDHVIHALFATEMLAGEYADALALAAADAEAEWQTPYTETDRAAERADARSRLSIHRYQLWDALPVVTVGALYDQDHTEPDEA